MGKKSHACTQHIQKEEANGKGGVYEGPKALCMAFAVKRTGNGKRVAIGLMRTSAQLGGPWTEPATFHKQVKPKSTMDTCGTCTHIDPIWPWIRDH